MFLILHQLGGLHNSWDSLHHDLLGNEIAQSGARTISWRHVVNKAIRHNMPDSQPQLFEVLPQSRSGRICFANLHPSLDSPLRSLCVTYVCCFYTARIFFRAPVQGNLFIRLVQPTMKHFRGQGVVSSSRPAPLPGRCTARSTRPSLPSARRRCRFR